MNADTPKHTAEPNTLSAVLATREACLAVHGDRLRMEESDRLFEARLQWFLALSAAA